MGGQAFLADQLYSVTVTEQIYTALKYVFFLPVQDVQKLPDMAFEAVRAFVVQKGQLGAATSGRIRDVAALPRADKVKGLRGAASSRADLKIR